MERKRGLKVAMIAGASEAIKFMNRNPRANEQETIQHVNNVADEIVENIEEEQ